MPHSAYISLMPCCLIHQQQLELFTMAMKTLLFFLVSLLLISTRVSSKDEDLIEAPYAKVPTPSPLKTPPPAPIPVKVPPPAPVPIKAKPPAPAPPVKPPVLPAPPVKPQTSAPKPPRNTKECYPPCVVRCSLHSRKNVCLRACVTCCDRCKCVPPGQYGNREKCGKCYVNMTTRGGRPKCP